MTRGAASRANVPPELHDTVAKIALLPRLDQLGKDLFHPRGIFKAFGVQPQPTANADAMGVADHASGDVVEIAQQQIGSLSAYTGQAKELVHSAGDFSTVVRNQHLAGEDNILCLLAEEAPFPYSGWHEGTCR